ncbi:variable surface protein [Plasmodium gonderi]|uniref:Variable surface protein n=1 Tax=Plasmodium gonderi TaxID=77519 RepID=A0A1Y1JT55_PLAGO|nr:variable surface protein [Plasmodium gonderi]GAW83962.1 variable surface protein [Plasmodium gonderi]
MSEFAFYFKKLGNQYPFLRNVWEVYDKLDEQVDESSENILYHKFCDTIRNKLNKKKKDMYSELCLKLLKNLGIFCNNTDSCRTDNEYCKILNNWLYISIRKYDLNGGIFSSIFNLIENVSTRLGYKSTCPYYFYQKNYAEPLAIIMLSIFQSNIGDIKDTLIRDHKVMKCTCQEFVDKVVTIYRRVKNKYCPSNQTNLIERVKKTCSYLNNFETSYNLYLKNEKSILEKKINVPSLKPEDNTSLFRCKSAGEFEVSLGIDEAQIPHDAEEDLIVQELDGALILLPESESFFSSTSIKEVLPTALATTAGVSSLLFLIYKFTPIGNMIRSSIKVKATRNFYGVEKKELLYPAHDSMDINSYIQRYDITYANL